MRPTPESTERVKQSAFEGLLIKAMRPTPALREALRSEGVDVERFEEDYPVVTWHRCVERVRVALYPDLSEAEGLEQVGRQFVRGFVRTLIGSVVGVAAPMIGPTRFLSRMPRIMNTSRMGRGMQLTVESVGPQEVVLHIDDPVALPEFNVGLVHEVLVVCKARPTVTLENRTETTFDLRVRW